ncbi:MAG: tRNA epoxyqueuosine(34) reductase QueG, partial [Alphaproteobacteria bacterium]|nr:tRNA epoxyqueuosine(34) reductase QueG [Alphaproteobacteria bacterium]
MRPLRPAPDPAGAAVRDAALALGFDAVGFAPAAAPALWGERLAAFLAAGYHGSMGWLADTAERRASPTTLWPEARSAIVVAMNYGPERDPLGTLALNDRATLSVYARNRDYHDVLKKQLRVLARFIHQTWGVEVKLFVDTAPVMEKPLAGEAGLGWQGKHTNLVSRAHGSWLFLGVVLTTLDLEPNEPEADHCGRCRACLDACPTAAFPAPYQLDARRCISYLTIEHAGPIPEELRPALGNRIYGCDDCLAVCPWNKFATPTTTPELMGRQDLAAPALADLAALDDAQFRALFQGSPIKRIGRNRFVRNVAIAIGNSGDASLRPSAARLAADPDPVVAEAGSWAVARLDQA